MSKYLLIESRDPYECRDVPQHYELAQQLVKEGHEVTLFLVQNGVFPARPGKASPGLTATSKAGVKVLADEFSLRERGIAAGKLAPGVTASPLDVVVDQLEAGAKTLWH